MSEPMGETGTTMRGVPTPPRGTTRVVGERPANRVACPGCDAGIHFKQLACEACWKALPSDFKRAFRDSEPGSAERKRVIADIRAEMRTW